MTIILWVLFGAVAGWVASMIMNRRESVLGYIVLGILGAVIGGFLAGLIGAPGVTSFNIYSLVVAVVGSIVLIWVGQLFYR